ncbi:MAG: ribosome biogenesis GTP-binding protein YihA/YsxC [Bacteroidota bacterium]
MKVQEAVFVKSSAKLAECPEPVFPEHAFIGRSNVGKSSLINALTGRKKLAKTSGTPGKTQLVNHFHINKNWYLVDLPGYGWAKVSKKDKAAFDRLIRSYIIGRENLLCVFVLIDLRHKAQQVDLDFMRWLGINDIPFSIIFTKADKLKKIGEVEQSITRFIESFLEEWEVMPEHFISSSVSKRGVEEILTYIANINKLFFENKKN